MKKTWVPFASIAGVFVLSVGLMAVLIFRPLPKISQSEWAEMQQSQEESESTTQSNETVQYFENGSKNLSRAGLDGMADVIRSAGFNCSEANKGWGVSSNKLIVECEERSYVVVLIESNALVAPQ